MPARSYSLRENIADALRRIVNTGPDTIGGMSASNREPWKGGSSGSSHSRIGFSRVMVPRSACHRCDERLGCNRCHAANGNHRLTQTIDPKLSVGIQYQLHHVTLRQQRTEDTKLALHSFREASCLPVAH